MHVLVTGGAGFIGSNLIRQVLSRAAIQRLVNLDCLTYAGNLVNLEAAVDHPNYVFEKVDLRDRAEVQRVVVEHDITHVLHLAAESHVDRSIAAPGDFVQTNVLGTFHLLEACRGHWLASAHASSKPRLDPRFVHVSTDEVYGSLLDGSPFTESSPYAPNSPYSASKAGADMLVRAYGRTYGLPVIITNCSNNYGPYQYPEKLIPVVIQRVMARQPIPIYGDGLQVRDWIHVLDHAQALWCVLERGRKGETYNIGGRNEWPNLRLVETLCDLLDELAPARFRDSRKLMTCVADRPGHDRRYALDISKIEREVGWSPAVDFAEGLRETVRWYLGHEDWLAQAARASTRGQRVES
ncbi:MAG TPA: dTDP-glucose 4,6-dehydratase [Verrucomicrobiae bacterium]|nr:dTDP-glucose 4,6-dehydratase [Verrucomicrobiae bacterium]